MNYKNIYEKLIDRSKSRLLEGYVEKHHILPRCMGGTNDPHNLVALTPEEHYIAHLLLVKIYPHKRGLWYAVKLMSGQGNNKSYGWVRRRLSEIGFTEEHKKNISKSQKIRKGPTKEQIKKRELKKEQTRLKNLEKIEQQRIIREQSKTLEARLLKLEQEFAERKRQEEIEANMFLTAHLYVI